MSFLISSSPRSCFLTAVSELFISVLPSTLQTLADLSLSFPSSSSFSYHIYPQKSLSQSINNVFGGIHLSFREFAFLSFEPRRVANELSLISSFPSPFLISISPLQILLPLQILDIISSSSATPSSKLRRRPPFFPGSPRFKEGGSAQDRFVLERSPYRQIRRYLLALDKISRLNDQLLLESGHFVRSRLEGEAGREGKENVCINERGVEKVKTIRKEQHGASDRYKGRRKSEGARQGRAGRRDEKKQRKENRAEENDKKKVRRTNVEKSPLGKVRLEQRRHQLEAFPLPFDSCSSSSSRVPIPPPSE